MKKRNLKRIETFISHKSVYGTTQTDVQTNFSSITIEELKPIKSSKNQKYKNSSSKKDKQNS
jgi:hypothetical protein